MNGRYSDILPENDCYIDLHLHIDGAISVKTALALAEMQAVRLPTYDVDELEKLLSADTNCKSLNEYLEKFVLPCSLMQSEDTISEAVFRLQEELKSEGLIYAELRFAPQKHTDMGLSIEDVVNAALHGLARSDFNANLILCCMRGEGNEKQNRETVLLADKYRNRGIAAVDLAGAEALYPNEKYKDLFELARSLNLNITIHSGEAMGPESVKSAVDLGARRIGHGVRAISDKTLMLELKQKKIALEMCISSNIQTKAVEKIDAYPIRDFMNNGVIVTINTDNPTVSHTTVKDEFNLAVEKLGLTRKDIYSLLKNSALYSFADDRTKDELINTIDKAFSA